MYLFSVVFLVACGNRARVHEAYIYTTNKHAPEVVDGVEHEEGQEGALQRRHEPEEGPGRGQEDA